MAAQTMQDLFLMHLKDIYHGEKQILKALPKMAEKASSPDLRDAFEKHREETEGQVQRLEQVFKMIGTPPTAKTCEAIQGLVEEGQEIMDQVSEPDILDAGLIAAGQAVEHYEMARYGTLVAWAQQMNMPEAAQLLEETLKEEKKADALLNDIAMSDVNDRAEQASGKSDQGSPKHA